MLTEGEKMIGAEIGRLKVPPLVAPLDSSRAAKALRYINKRRALICQPELDPIRSGWTDDDLLAEATRLGWERES